MVQTENDKLRYYVFITIFIFALTFLIGVVLGLHIETSSTLEEESVTAATDIAQEYFQFEDIECDLNYFCFIKFQFEASEIQFPFAKWQIIDGDIIEINRIEGYENCLANPTSDIAFRYLIGLSLLYKICPLPKRAIALDNVEYILVESATDIYSLINYETRLDDIIVYRTNNDTIVLKNSEDSQFHCGKNLTLQSELNRDCYFDVDLSPTSAILSVYELSDFNLLTSSISPTKMPTKFPFLKTAQPTHTPTKGPAKNPTPAEFDEKYKGSKPNIVVVMLDDVGYGDVGFGGVDGFEKPREKIQEATPFITNLAHNESIILKRHYGHWHCSPSRRSFLTGRLSIHTGERLSRQADHDLDLRFKWISEQLKVAGYSNYLVGKGHFGYESVYHLPTLRGFDEFVGILNGQAKYNDLNFWSGHLGNQTEFNLYSTHYFGLKAQEFINRHEATNDPFFLLLSLQSPHTPIEPPNINYERYKKYTEKKTHPYEYMMYTADYEIEQMVSLLKRKGMWDNTLLLFVADNGATSQNLWTKAPYKNWKTRGSNYPFRGEKKSSFEGGFRVPAFLSGGIIPKTSRGQKSGLISHISDWYQTFCYLAGIEVDTDKFELNQEEFYEKLNVLDLSQTDPRSPSTNKKNLWGNHFPAVDSINLAHYLLIEKLDTTEYHPAERKNQLLMLSTEAMIYKKYKFIAAQPCSFFAGTTTCKEDKHLYSWITRNARNFVDNGVSGDNLGCLKLNHPEKDVFYEPCVFDLSNDLSETTPIENTSFILELFDLFNNSLLSQYTDYLVGKENGLTPDYFLNSSSTSADETNLKQLELFGTLQSPTKHISSCTISNKRLECPTLSFL